MVFIIVITTGVLTQPRFFLYRDARIVDGEFRDWFVKFIKVIRVYWKNTRKYLQIFEEEENMMLRQKMQGIGVG